MLSRTDRARWSVALVVVVTAVMLCAPTGWGKGKPPANQPVTATFVSTPGVGITGDSNGDYPAIFDQNGEFYLELPAGGPRWVTLNFNDRIAPGSCGSSCFFNGSLFPAVNIGIGKHGHLWTNLVDAHGNEVDGGIANMPSRTWMNARFLVTFDNPDGSANYLVLRYYPPAFPMSTYVHVWRDTCGTSDCWEIHAIDDTNTSDYEAARLTRPLSVRLGYSNEGLYHVPFKIMVTRP